MKLKCNEYLVLNVGILVQQKVLRLNSIHLFSYSPTTLYYIQPRQNPNVATYIPTYLVDSNYCGTL